jgi:hypothetical protein
MFVLCVWVQEAGRREQLAMAGRDWVRVQEIGDRGGGFEKARMHSLLGCDERGGSKNGG